MVTRWRKARRRRRAECPECGAPKPLTDRLQQLQVEREQLWAAVEALTTERDQLIRKLSGVKDDPDDRSFPPPPGVRARSPRH